MAKTLTKKSVIYNVATKKYLGGKSIKTAKVFNTKDALKYVDERKNGGYIVIDLED